MVSAIGWLVLLVLAGVEPTAADAVTLRDGKTVLGQVVEPSPGAS